MPTNATTLTRLLLTERLSLLRLAQRIVGTALRRRMSRSRCGFASSASRMTRRSSTSGPISEMVPPIWTVWRLR